MLKRKIEKILEDWSVNRKQALLITGARQVGKSFSIINFINNRYSSVISIDFAKRPELIDNFATLINSKDFLMRMSLIAGDKLIENETVIFLDEIQLVYRRRDELIKNNIISSMSQDLLTAMKEMVQEGKYRFILSGSLLGVTIKNVILNPTGYLDEYKMYPLDFEEFLWAKGVGEMALNHIKDCFDKKTPVDEGIHKVLMNYFKEYVLVGGMPEAVETYINEKNLFLVQKVQSQIFNKYLKDVTTYIDNDNVKLRVKNILSSAPSQLSNKNMRFVASNVIDLSYLKHNFIDNEFLWLDAAGVVIPTYHVNQPIIPLILSKDRKTLKLFLNDIGLLISQLVDTGIREKLLNGEKEINYGAPYENVVAQELIAHGFDEELFYYNSKKHGEVDFLVTYKGDVLPIEIKSGKNKQCSIYDHTALNNLLKLYNYNRAYVFGETNVIKENDIIYQFPIYMIDLIRK